VFLQKRLFLRVTRCVGLIRLFQFLHRHEILIWMIHGVMDDRDGPGWRPLRPRLSPDKLEEYLDVLSQRYHFVSLLDAVEMLRGDRPMQPYSMVLTFDDGYRNNFTHALPILRRHGVPATFFVSSGYVEPPRPFWFDRLDYALQQAPVDGREVRIGQATLHLEAGTREALQGSFQRFRDQAKEQQVSDPEFLAGMEQLAGQLESESGRALSDLQRDDDWSAVATWEEIGRALAQDVTVGSHTVDHLRLDCVPPEMAREQLVRSKQEIEQHTHEPCLCLAYPNGSYSARIAEMARNCAYRCGVTTEEGWNSPGDDLLTLKRMDLPVSVGSVELLARACGLSRFFASLKARVTHPRAAQRRRRQKPPVHGMRKAAL
jgi:peptidoglycan/xylan/chitin deacetylase (PgdA/CDA1 family)